MGMKVKDEKKGKKRIFVGALMTALISVVAIFGIGASSSSGADADYMSKEELEAAKNEGDLSTDELVAQFYDWYGYLPDTEEEDYNFLNNSLYADYDGEKYEDVYYDPDADDEAIAAIPR